MKSIRVAAVSMNGGLGQPERSLDEIARWCQRAQEAEAELVLFPELVVHGHCTPNTGEIAESVPDGPSVRRLELLARESNLVLSVGLSEREGDNIYNTQVLVTPSGYVGKQRKIHMSRDEVLHYQGGCDMPVIDVGKCRVGTIICFDNLFPEISRTLALRGADVMLAPHAARLKMWDDAPESEAAARRYTYDTYLQLRLRGRENACFYVVTDQVGRAGYVDRYARDHPNQPHHAGGAMIIGPGGEVLAASQTERIQDEMITATLSGAALDEERNLSNYPLKVRRPELFGDLVDR